MPCVCYREKKFTTAHHHIIDAANTIIGEYQEEGFDLTLRQLYYQFVSRDLLANTQKEYKRLGGIINDARLAGLINWHAIVDRTRFLRSNSHWNNPEEIVQECAKGYQIDKWEFQDHRLEVWIEKDALTGVIEDVCARNDVPFFSCRGYTSQSELWRASQRLMNWMVLGQKPVVIHLGDHDPSGIDMTRDIMDRLIMFSGGAHIERIALNTDQVKKYKPPPNPTKLTDSRATGYIAKFGYDSWELDALEPKVIVKLIEDTIDSFRDEKEWKIACKRERADKRLLKKVADHWSIVTEDL
jgi:hypothetical protein